MKFRTIDNKLFSNEKEALLHELELKKETLTQEEYKKRLDWTNSLKASESDDF
jgi:hypothetical protein